MKKLTILSIVSLTALSFFSACSGGKGSVQKQSNKTGAMYNEKRPGSLMVARKPKPAPFPGLIQVEGGTFVMGGTTIDDIGYDYAAPKKRVTVATFYMDETEVSNVNWLEYLNWTLKVAEDPRWYYEALPDTLVWRNALAYNEPYVTNYLRHPAYQDYPVVGVTWEQANAYCRWRTNVVNENKLRSLGIMNTWKDVSASNSGKGGSTKSAAKVSKEPFDVELYLNGQYDDMGKKPVKDLNAVAAPGSKSKGDVGRKAIMEDGIMSPGSYRLPTEAEWEYAALSQRSSNMTGNDNNIPQSKIYPWEGLGVRSPNKKTRGLVYANFKIGDGDNMGVAGYLNDGADITAPVTKYVPNDFGLYNMAGNVNEWVYDTYRQLSFEEVEDFNPFRGNDFKNTKYDSNGKIEIIGKTNVPKKEASTSGQKLSYESQKMKYGNAVEESPTTPELKDPKMATATVTYKADVRGAKDEQNLDLFGKITNVSDRSKVYKGGSWNDRAYWLNPGTRRYKDQGEASSEIGFRCAMSSVGDPQIDPKSTPQFRASKSKAGK